MMKVGTESIEKNPLENALVNPFLEELKNIRFSVDLESKQILTQDRRGAPNSDFQAHINAKGDRRGEGKAAKRRRPSGHSQNQNLNSDE